MTILTYLDQNRRWKWGYFEPKYFKIVGDRIVNVASTKPFDIALQFGEAFAVDGAIYRNVWLVTCRVRRDICERVYDAARSLWISEPPPHLVDVVKALTLIRP